MKPDPKHEAACSQDFLPPPPKEICLGGWVWGVGLSDFTGFIMGIQAFGILGFAGFWGLRTSWGLGRCARYVRDYAGEARDAGDSLKMHIAACNRNPPQNAPKPPKP